VGGNRFRASVQALFGQLLAQPNDRILSLGVDRLRALECGRRDRG